VNESQGKIYDNVGSTGISAITDAVGAIYAATEAVKIGSYAYGIATGVYKYSGGALVDATTSLPIANFALKLLNGLPLRLRQTMSIRELM